MSKNKDRFNSGDFDSLVSDSTIRLFGRLVWELKLRETTDRNSAYTGGAPSSGAMPPLSLGNNFLIEQLKKPNATLARISSFSYQNELFDFAKPAIFLVHGDGSNVEFTDEAFTDGLFLKKAPPHIERSGLVGQKGSFAPEVKMWAYDRADFTIRLDTETGTLDQLVLAWELGGAIGTGSMHAANTDPPPPPPPGGRRRRRWRNDET